MGIRHRSSRKVFPGVRVNRNNDSTSITVGGKYRRRTINTKTGKVTETTRIPGTHVSYTTTSYASEPQRTASPLSYKICGILALIIGIVAVLIGLISLSAGGWVFIILGLLPLYFGYQFLKLSKHKRKGE